MYLEQESGDVCGKNGAVNYHAYSIFIRTTIYMASVLGGCRNCQQRILSK